ncbi:MAG: hypothetical protein ACTSWY_10485 [Promethearchaeota archaeon]
MDENTGLLLLSIFSSVLFLLMGIFTLRKRSSYLLNKLIFVFYFSLSINFIFNAVLKFEFVYENENLFLVFVKICLMFVSIGWISLTFSMIIIRKSAKYFGEYKLHYIYYLVIFIILFSILIFPDSISYNTENIAHPIYSFPFGTYLMVAIIIFTSFILYLVVQAYKNSPLEGRKRILLYGLGIILFLVAIIISLLSSMRIFPSFMYNIVSIVSLAAALIIFFTVKKKSE